MPEYLVLSQDEQDDIIVSFMLGQERDKFCHELNLQRYTDMLKTEKAGEWRDRVSKLKGETVSRLAEVNSIINVTIPQMPPPGRITAAKQRLTTV
ncbi:unnamed protein product [marine sediment metagenome]|uniref:Uncharacterized protein n=1 Tax=marine sediment metagenome TaxID=412755 RepID=X1PZM6_9ZZZZ